MYVYIYIRSSNQENLEYFVTKNKINQVCFKPRVVTLLSIDRVNTNLYQLCNTVIYCNLDIPDLIEEREREI